MKPNNDSEKPWEVISSEYLHKNLWLTVRKDHVVLPNGNHIPSYYILEYPNWVNTIAITRDGQFVLSVSTGMVCKRRPMNFVPAYARRKTRHRWFPLNGSSWKKPATEMVHGGNSCRFLPTQALTLTLRIAFLPPM